MIYRNNVIQCNNSLYTKESCQAYLGQESFGDIKIFTVLTVINCNCDIVINCHCPSNTISFTPLSVFNH